MARFITPSVLNNEIGATENPNSFRGAVPVSWLKSPTVGEHPAELDTQNRAYQREKVCSVSWKQNILKTILSGSYARIPEIHIRVLRHNGIWVFELVDGQQRVVAVLDFLNGKYPLPKDFIISDENHNINLSGMYVHEVEQQYEHLYNRIMCYDVGCAWYENLTDEMTSDLFTEILNNVNDMSPQELRNAVLGKLSQYVRDLARPIGSNYVHPLFERITKNKGTTKEKETMELFRISLRGRMEMDEWLTELIYLKLNGFRKGLPTQQKITEWWKDIQRNGEYKDRFKDKQKIDKLLNLAYNIIRAGNNMHKNKMNSMHTLILVLYADELQSRFDCKINPQKYVNKFFEVYNKWDDPIQCHNSGMTQLNGNVLPEFSLLYNGKNSNAVGSICQILDLEVADDSTGFGIIQIDPKETFSEDDRYRKWIEQDKKDYYDDFPLDWEDAVGDHFIPRSWGIEAGGKTNYSNLVITSKSNNLRKANRSGEEFQLEINASS